MVFWNWLFLFFVVLPMMIAWVDTAVDIFRRPYEGGLAKFGWLMLILFLPIHGTLIYSLPVPATWR